MATKRKNESVSNKIVTKKQRDLETEDGFLSTEEIHRFEKRILESSSNYNDIVKLQNDLKKSIKLQSEEDHTIELLTVLFKVFGKLLKKGELGVSAHLTDVQLEVVKWLSKRYDAFKNTLFNVIQHNNSDTLQVLCLQLSMRFLKLESQYIEQENNGFPKALLQSTIKSVYFSNDDSEQLLESFLDEYLAGYDDLRYYILKNLEIVLTSPDILNHKNANLASERLFNHLIMTGENFPESDDQLTDFMFDKPKKPENTKIMSPYQLESHKHAYQRALLTSFRLPLTQVQLKEVLEVMHTSIIPNMAQPQYLMDFLSDAYENGGSIALLALNSLFYLIQHHNLDYPKFFTQLYKLLDPSILHVKYRSRFLRLLDLFLTSTHISVAVVASFIKRLARLALFAPPGAIVAIVPFIYNQLKRHPLCMTLIHRPEYSGPEEDALLKFKDPYDNDQLDPILTNAIDSSLWELESLQSHYHPNVATLARIMSEQFRKPQYVLEDFLDMSYQSLMASEQNRKLKRAPALEFERFDSVFEDDINSQNVFMAGWMY